VTSSLQSMLCPGCGSTIRSGAKRCVKCGASLAPAECPRCGQEHDLTAPVCTKCLADLRTRRCVDCGAPNVSVAARCSRCGHGLGPHSRHRTEAAGPDYWTAIVILFAAVALLVTSLVLNAEVDGSEGFFLLLAAVLGGTCVPLSLAAMIPVLMAARGVKSSTFGLVLVAGGSLGVAISLPLYFIVQMVALGVGLMLALPVIIGAAEELGKLISIGWLLPRQDFVSELHGLAFGVAAGLGFSATENIVYILAAHHHGGPKLATVAVLMRILTSALHAVWTGSLAAVLWRERRISVQYTAPVIGTYVIVATLHACWNYQIITDPSSRVATLLMVLSAVLTAALFAVRLRLALGAGSADKDAAVG